MSGESRTPGTPLMLTVLGLVGILAAISVGLTLYLVVQNANAIPPAPGKTAVSCTVLIIGSGFAGSYAAYRLAPVYKDQLCLVERLARDGGRIYDVSEYPGGPVFGAGALRVPGEQTLMLKLAWELGITLQTVAEEVELLKVRGRHYYRSDSANETETVNRMCGELFPTMNCSTNPQNATDGLMYGILSKFRKESPHILERHADFPSLMLGLFGDEGLAFFKENAYHSLLTSVAVPSVLEFIETEGSFGNLSYPEGGMSQYTSRMLKRAKEAGMRIFHSEPVVSINFGQDQKFTTETKSMVVSSERVLCSIEPLGFSGVTGNVAQKVKDAPEFRAIAPKTSITVAAWWNERWWEDSKFHAKHNLTRVTSHANCFNGMEIATYPYGRQQNVTRVVYDDGACLDTWRELISGTGGTEKLIDEIRRSLGQVFTNVTIPQPRTFKAYVHDNAWHFQQPFSRKSNQEILEWSLHPFPHEHFALIGEAYNLSYSGWCEGALRSAIKVLDRHYGLTSPGMELRTSEDFLQRVMPKRRLRLP